MLDLPIEEADEFRNMLAVRGIDTILLLSPTTTDERLRRAAALGSGFLYAISRLGVTGARDRIADGAHEMVDRIRRVSDLPVALGFGISTARARPRSRAMGGCCCRRQRPRQRHCRGRVLGGSEQTGRGVRALAEVLTIEELRSRIDVIDEQLVRLLNVRVACAVEVGRLKHEAGVPIYQPDREAQVLERRQKVSDRSRRPADGGSRRADLRAGDRRSKTGGARGKRAARQSNNRRVMSWSS